MRIALAPTNSTVGDLRGKVRCILGYARRANHGGNKSELAIGYCTLFGLCTKPPSILRAYLEQYQPARQIAESHHVPIELVRDIINKRRQAAPGLKVTTKAFGIGRRFSIAQRFYE